MAVEIHLKKCIMLLIVVDRLVAREAYHTTIGPPMMVEVHLRNDYHMEARDPPMGEE